MSDTEREAPVATTRRGARMTAGRRNALVLLGVGCLIAFVFWRDPGRQREADPAPPGGVSAIAATTIAQLLGPPPVPPPETAGPAYPAPPTPAGGSILPTGEKKKRMLSYETRAAPPAAAGGEDRGERAGTGRDGAGGRGGPVPTAVSFDGQPIAGRRAGVAIDQTLTLMPGLYACVLDVALSSEHPGPFFCHTKRDIKSPLNVTLMKAGTQIQGSTQSMGGGTTESRIMTLSATAWTPEGVPVPLGGPMADQTGRVGLAGAVDRHLWARLQGAVVLMVTQGAVNAASAALQPAIAGRGSGNTFVNLNTGGVNAALAQALRDGTAIRNTVTVNQGEEVAFYVTAPISFADAYTLSPAGEAVPR